MAYKDFINDFRKGITKDVLVFYGDEDFLMDWAVRAVTDKYVDAEWRSLDVRQLDGSTVNAYDIMGEARAYSMFSERRVVIVKDWLPMYRKTEDAGGQELLSFAAARQDTSVLIFTVSHDRSADINAFGKKLIKAAGSYEFARLEKGDLKSFINKRVHDAGKIISRRDLELLIDLTGYYNRDSSYDLTRLDADMAKLVKAAPGDEIGAALIEDILVGESDRYVFNLVDALVSGNRRKAMEITETLLSDGDETFKVIALLIKQFEIMYDSLELSSQGMSIAQMAKKTGVHEFRFKKAWQAAQAYSPARIRKLLVDLYNIDRDIKRGEVDKDIALELFVVSAVPGR